LKNKKDIVGTLKDALVGGISIKKLHLTNMGEDLSSLQ